MKNIFLLIILLATIFAAYVYGYPAFTALMVDRQKIAEVQTVQNKISAIKDERNQLIERLKSIDPNQVARLETMLPRVLNEEELYVFFQSFIEKYSLISKGILVTKSAPVAGGEATPFVKSSLSFDVKVEGSYENMRLFLEGVENNLRLMDISSIGITKTDRGTYILALAGDLYYGN